MIAALDDLHQIELRPHQKRINSNGQVDSCWFHERRSEGPCLFVSTGYPKADRKLFVNNWQESLVSFNNNVPLIQNIGFGKVFLLSDSPLVSDDKTIETFEREYQCVIQFSFVFVSPELLVFLQEFVDLTFDSHGSVNPFILATTPERICYSWASSNPMIPLDRLRLKAFELPSMDSLLSCLEEEMKAEKVGRHKVLPTPTSYSNTYPCNKVCFPSTSGISKCFETLANAIRSRDPPERDQGPAHTNFILLPIDE